LSLPGGGAGERTKGEAIVSAVQVLVYLAVAALVLVRVIGRQVVGSPVTVRSLVVTPAVLLVVGAAGTRDVLPSASVGALLLFGASIALGERDGTLFQRGTKLTLVLWLVTIALRVGFGFGGHLLGVDDRLASVSVALTVGLTIGAQNLAIWWRAQRLGVPMAAASGRR
jgi:hypothetical protein